MSSSCLVYLRKKEIVFFARPSVCSYLLIFAPLVRGDKIVAEKSKRWLICRFIIFFNLGEQQVNVLLHNCQQSACDD